MSVILVRDRNCQPICLLSHATICSCYIYVYICIYVCLYRYSQSLCVPPHTAGYVDTCGTATSVFLASVANAKHTYTYVRLYTHTHTHTRTIILYIKTHTHIPFTPIAHFTVSICSELKLIKLRYLIAII